MTFAAHGGSRGAAQIDGVLAGLRMTQLDDHRWIAISRGDLDERWQLTDLEATLAPHGGPTRAIDVQMTAAMVTRTPSAE